jgi:hypothetical protein
MSIFEPKDRKDHIFLFQTGPIDSWVGWEHLQFFRESFLRESTHLNMKDAYALCSILGKQIDTLLLNGLHRFSSKIETPFRDDKIYVYNDSTHHNHFVWIAFKSDNNGTCHAITSGMSKDLPRSLPPTEYDQKWEFVESLKI